MSPFLFLVLCILFMLNVVIEYQKREDVKNFIDNLENKNKMELNYLIINLEEPDNPAFVNELTEGDIDMCDTGYIAIIDVKTGKMLANDRWVDVTYIEQANA